MYVSLATLPMCCIAGRLTWVLYRWLPYLCAVSLATLPGCCIAGHLTWVLYRWPLYLGAVPLAALPTWVCGADERGRLVQCGQVEPDRLVVVFRPVAAHDDGRVPLLDNLAVPLDHQTVLKRSTTIHTSDMPNSARSFYYAP